MTVLVRAHGATDVGRVRDHNEDKFFVDPADSFFVVADGVGGYEHGEMASRIAIEDISGVTQGAEAICRNNDQAADFVLKMAFLGAHQRIQQEQIQLGKKNGTSRSSMGTTAVTALRMGRRLTVANTGDSRAYLLRAGKFTQITYDHSMFNDLVEADPKMDEQKRATLRQQISNIITQYLGMAGTPLVDITAVDLRRGDRLLLCSDGLTDLVRDGEIATTLMAESVPEMACHMLIAQANHAGGRDNITVVVADFTGDELPELSPDEPELSYALCKQLAATPQPNREPG